MTIPFHRVAGLLYNRPLFLTPQAALTISEVLQRHIEARIQNVAVDEQRIEREMRSSAFIGDQLKDDGGGLTPYRVTKDGTAIITVDGELVNRGSWVGADSGLVSYEGIKHQLSAAARDPRVKSIVIDMNSPGGEAVGMGEVAAAVRRAAATKPVTAIPNGLAASAGYGAISGATRIVTPPDGLGGSIGTLLMHLDVSHALQNRGVKPTLIFAGDHKIDGNPYEALPKEVRDDLQLEVNKYYDMFVNVVAAGRKNLSTDAIKATQARTYVGADLVDVGLADELGTFDDVLADHATLNTKPVSISPRVAAAKPTKEKAMNFTPEFKKSLGLSENASDAEVEAKVAEGRTALSRLQSAEMQLATEKEQRQKAEREAKRIEATTKIDALVREGKLSGNSAEAFKKVYLAAANGEAVTLADMDALAVSLPKIDATRIAENVQPPTLISSDVSLADFSKAGTDVAASKRISAAVAERKKTNPKFNAAMLEREMRAGVSR